MANDAEPDLVDVDGVSFRDLAVNLHISWKFEFQKWIFCWLFFGPQSKSVRVMAWPFRKPPSA